MINQLKDEYSKLINDFSIIDENDPITSEKLNLLNQSFEELSKFLSTQKSELKKNSINFGKKNNHTTKKYNKKVESITEINNQKIENNKESHILMCNNIKNKLEETKKELEYNIQQIEIDHTFFISSIEQGKMIIYDDFLKSRKRYDYQLEQAKQTYSYNVNEKNIELDHLLKELENKYLSTSSNFQKEHVTSTIKIQEKIDELQKELSSYHNMVNLERNSNKEKHRKESTLLNEDIKKIIDEKNINLDITKNEYTQTINDINLEKEEKKNILHNKTQSILREFVTKINELDEETNQLKENYDNIITKYKRDYYEEVYKKTNDFHNEILKLHDSINDKKYLNKLLKIKNKQLSNLILSLKKETQNKIIEITKDYLINLNNIKTTIAYLEIEKNYNIKNLNDEEQYNNKYYQEKANIYENDYNLYVKNINIDFNKKANSIKLRSEKRIKLLERHHIGIDENYSKNVETLNAKINKLKFELDYENDLEKHHDTYQENKYNNSIHLTKAKNLLEIEKIKLLKEYNISRYNFHINELELEKKYGMKKIDLENDFQEINKNYEIKGVKLQIEKNILTSSYAIKKEEIYEEFNKLKISIVNENSNVLAKEKYINTLKDNNIFYINLIKNCVIETINKLLTYYHSVITELTNIEINLNNYKYLDRFIYSFNKIINNLYINFIDYIINLINETTIEKINFIHDFRYKEQFDSLKNDYLLVQQDYRKQKEDLILKIDLNDKTIENVKNKIFTLINDNGMLENTYKFSKHKKHQDNKEYKLINENEIKIQDYKDKIDELNKLNKSLYAQLNEHSKIMRIKINQYKQDKNIIKKKKKFDTIVFINFKEATKIFQDKIIIFTNRFNELFDNETKKPSSFINKIDKYDNYFEQLSELIILGLTKLINNYDDNIKKENEIRNKLNKENHLKQIDSYTLKLNNELEKFENEYNITFNKHKAIIEENQHNILENKKFYEKLLNEAKQGYADDISNLNKLFMKETDDFYKNFYALEANSDNIIKYHDEIYKNNKQSFKNHKDLLNKNRLEDCTSVDEELKNFINEKNTSIQNLPVYYKNLSKSLEKEVKKKNKDLNEELHKFKNLHYTERKNLDRIIYNFKEQLDSLINENNYNLEQNLKDEEHNSKISLKQSIKSIKIEL